LGDAVEALGRQVIELRYWTEVNLAEQGALGQLRWAEGLAAQVCFSVFALPSKQHPHAVSLKRQRYPVQPPQPRLFHREI